MAELNNIKSNAQSDGKMSEERGASDHADSDCASIKTDAEPATSNESSFKDESVAGEGDPETHAYLSSDLNYIGSRFGNHLGGNHVQNNKKRPWEARDDLTARKKPTQKEVVNIGPLKTIMSNAEIETTGAGRDIDTDDETVGHVKEAEANTTEAADAESVVGDEEH